MVRRKPPAGTQINWGHSIANALVGCFPMNEGSGSRIRDLVNGVVGTLSGTVLPTWQGGPDGFSLKFAGGTATNSYIDCGANAQLANLARANSAGGPMGCSFFFRAMWDGAASTGGLAERNDNNSVNAGWIVGFNSASTMMCLQEFSTTNERDTFTSPTAGQWFDILVSYDEGLPSTVQPEGGTFMRVYIDGVPITVSRAGQANGTSGSDAANTFFIGREQFQAAGSWNGLISTAMFWRRALSRQEAQQLHEDPWAVLRYPDDDIFSQQFSQTLDASMSTFSGALSKQTGHIIAASMSTFSGALSTLSTFFRTLDASMNTFSATLNKSTAHTLNAAMATFSGAVAGVVPFAKAFTAAMTQFAATLFRQTGKVLTAGMATFSGALTTVFIPSGNLVTIDAGMSTFAGALSQSTGKHINAGMATFSATLVLTVHHGQVPSVCTPVACTNDPNLISHIEPCDKTGS